MKYLVMECHPAYAVVMDQKGRFLQVANQHFEVGQQVEEVIPMQDVRADHTHLWRKLAAVAACLCLLLLGSWQLLLNPYGSVRIQINPDVKITVNRLEYVIRVEPLNPDAQHLLQGYAPGIQKIDQVADELADRAKEMGYLHNNGKIQVTVESSHANWRVATQDRLILELQLHTQNQITVIPNPDPIPGFSDQTVPTVSSTSTAPTAPAPITAEEAKALAFSHLGVREDQVSQLQTELDDGIYEIEFLYDGMEYSFEIDAATGTILDIDQDLPDDPDDLDDEDEEDDEYDR